MTLLSFSTPAEFLSRRVANEEQAKAVNLLPKRPVMGQRLVGPILVLLLWYLASGMGWISAAKMPGPGSVVASLVEMIETGSLASDITISLERAAAGLAIGIVGGFVLAVVAGLTRIGDALID